MNLSIGLEDLFEEMDEWFYVNKTPLEVWIDERFSVFNEWLTTLREAGFHHLFVDFIMWAIILVFACVFTAIILGPFFGAIKLVKLLREDYFERKYRLPLETRMAASRSKTHGPKPVVERITEVTNDGETLTKSDLHQHLQQLIVEYAKDPDSSIEKFSAVLSPDSKYYGLLDKTLKAEIEAIVNSSDRQVTNKDTLVTERS